MVHLRRCLATYICYSNGTLRRFRVVSACALHSAVPHICVSRLVECVRTSDGALFCAVGAYVLHSGYMATSRHTECTHCGAPTVHGRATCSEACRRARSGRSGPRRGPPRPCRNCGAPARPHCATCSEACRVAVVHTDCREVRQCAQCGGVFKVYRTSTQACCSRECSFARVRSRRSSPTCVVCARPVPHRERKTCSDACMSKMYAARAEATRRSRPGVGSRPHIARGLVEYISRVCKRV